MEKIDWNREIITSVTPRDNLKEAALKCEEESVDCIFAKNINPFGRTIEKAIIHLKPLLSKGITVFFLSCGMRFREVTNQLSVAMYEEENIALQCNVNDWSNTIDISTSVYGSIISF